MTKLSRYFVGVAAKRLSAVEADPATSNQHEFNGIRAMCELFGIDKVVMKCTYLYFGEDEERTATAEGILTWYDARENHPTRTEYRLYFQGNNVMEQANAGDLLVIGRRPDGTALALVAKHGSTFERQVLWLFGIEEKGRTGFVVSTMEGGNNRQLGFAERMILETLGIEAAPDETNWLNVLLERFGEKFPDTRTFSAFARGSVNEFSAHDNPDLALISWINQEEMLFRVLERYIVQNRLNSGFDNVDVFVEFSLSVHNRRKSRMGFALENHLEQVFLDNKIHYSREKITENKSKPDFIFPGIEQYHDEAFPSARLTMLGAKSTCKDRWRQVLTEAKRIKEKHLLTLEPGISINQTVEMKSEFLQLVLPQALHESYLPEQQSWLMNLSEFIELVKKRQ